MHESQHKIPDDPALISFGKSSRHTAQAAHCSACVLAWLVAVSFSVSGAATTAFALDLNKEADIMTDTVAGREWLPQYNKKDDIQRVTQQSPDMGLPEGLRVGNFFLYPSISTSATFDDNVFSSAYDPKADWRMEIAPMLVLQSQLPRHEINVVLGARSVSFLENSDQDYVDLNALLRGALHIDHAHTLSAAFSSTLNHEERGDSLAPKNAAEPVPIERNRLTASITRDAGRLYGTLSGSIENLDYGNVEATDGTILNQSMRDQMLFSGQIRAGYRLSPGFEVIGKVRVSRQDKTSETATGGDSIGYEALAGIAMETSPLLKWQLLGGYGIRDYDNADLDNVSSMLAEGRLEWFPTQRMTVTGVVHHAIDDTLGANDGGRIVSSASGRIDYEIYHNLFGHAQLMLDKTEYIGADRDDLTFEAGVGLDYYYTKNWMFSLDYKFQDRSSTDPDYDMTRNQFRVGAKLSF